MHIWTHKLLAEMVYETVSKSSAGVLNRSAFIHGNLLPDLNSQHKQFDHYTHNCWGYMEQMAGEMRRLQCRTEHGSRKMGIICHFIADFFCKVHNRPYADQTSLVGHVIYENQLHRLYKEIMKERSYLMDYACIPSEISGNLGQQWFSERMAEVHREYMNNTPDIEMDIYFALRSCVEFCMFMIAYENTVTAGTIVTA